MASCKDCIHYDICIFHLKGNENERCVNFIPTADVVPRAEVEGIFAEIEKIFGDAINGSAFYGMQYAELKKKHIKN